MTIADGGVVDTGLFGLLRANYEHYVRLNSRAVYVPLDEQSDEEIKNIVMASCSIPFVFPPVRIGGHNYYDGGLYDNLPITPIKASGCDKVIVVNLNRFDYLKTERYPGMQIVEVKHHRLLGSVLKYDRERCRQLYELGYAETKECFPETVLKEFMEE